MLDQIILHGDVFHQQSMIRIRMGFVLNVVCVALL
jgi:hypothetical protein